MKRLGLTEENDEQAIDKFFRVLADRPTEEILAAADYILITSLGKMFPALKKLAFAISLGLIESEIPFVRARACGLLGLADSDEDVTKSLILCLSDADQLVRETAQASLRRLGYNPKEE